MGVKASRSIAGKRPSRVGSGADNIAASDKTGDHDPSTDRNGDRCSFFDVAADAGGVGSDDRVASAILLIKTVNLLPIDRHSERCQCLGEGRG